MKDKEHEQPRRQGVGVPTEASGEEIQFEPENNEPPKGGDAELKVKKLKDNLAQCQNEKQEYMDGWQRAKADYVNLLKRSGEDRAVAVQAGTIRAVEELLPAFDALERAKEHGDLPEGFIAIVKRLESGFSALGLEALGEVGEPFSPALHEALGQDEVAEKEKDDIVNAVLERGWKIGTMVIRPAKVRIGHFMGSSGKPDEGRVPGR